MILDEIRSQSAQAANDICEIAKLKKGDIVVIGCSSSEVCGHKVGSASSPETAEAIFEGLSSVFTPKGIYIAAQCCEHLNRAISAKGTAAFSMMIARFKCSQHCAAM